MKIDIVNIKPIKVAAMEHLGDPETLEKSVEALRAWRKESDNSPVAEKRTFGVAMSNPEAIPAPVFRFDICAEVDVDVPANSYGVINKIIPGGRCARLRHKGPYEDLSKKVNAIFRNWLPTTEESKRDAPIFFEYLNALPEVSASELITDIYFPLK